MDFIKEMLPELKGHKIVIYGADVTGLSFLLEAGRAGLEVAYLVDGNKSKWGTMMYGKEICAPYDLLCEDKNLIKIVICAPTGKNSIIHTLEDMGFEADKHIDVRYIEKKDQCDHIDITMGISRGNKTIVDMRGSGTGGKRGVTVLILGGSTSDPSYNGIHSWPYYFQKLLDEAGINARVLNGAVIGYSSSQELLCLLRDGLRHKPDIVISYTGYNDYTPALDLHGGKRLPLVSKNLYDIGKRMITVYEKEKQLPPVYFGEEIEDHFELFFYNVRCMKALCDEFSAKYFALFQPMLQHQRIIPNSLEEKLLEEDMIKALTERCNRFYEQFRTAQKSCSYLYDFTDIFQEESDVFSDICHTNEKGNKIIAKAVLGLLMNSGSVESIYCADRKKM